jgi:hypothetical protein
MSQLGGGQMDNGPLIISSNLPDFIFVTANTFIVMF